MAFQNESRKERKTRLEKEYLVKVLLTEAAFMLKSHRYEAAERTMNKVLHHVEDYNLRDAFFPSMFTHEDFQHVLPVAAQAMLTIRGEACLRQGKLKSALEDVEKVIRSNPLSSKAISIKADVLFLQCKFEHALVFYERGLRICSEAERPNFLIGKQRAVESIGHALFSVTIFSGLENFASLLNPERTGKMLWGIVYLLLKTGAFKLRQQDDGPVQMIFPTHKESQPDELTLAIDQLAAIKKKKRIHSTQGPLCGPKVGRAIGVDKQAHLKQEETYFKMLMADPRVKRGSSKTYLTRAIADAIEFIESRERFWSQQL